MTKPLTGLVKDSLKRRGAEPRHWVADDAQTPAVRLPRVGIVASPELIEYAAAAERRSFREAVAGLFEEGPFSQWSLHPVRSPSTLLFELSPAHVTAFLAGLQPIGEDPDSGAVLVASWGRGQRRSTVASFLFDDVSPVDEVRGDFVFEAASLRALLGPKAPPRPRASPASRALEQRYRRAVWLGRLFFGPDFWVDDAEDGALRAVREAAGPEAYLRERRVLASRPDLAAYWLLAHAVLGAVAELDDALTLTRAALHPAVIDLRATLRTASEGPKVLEELVTRHREELPEGFLEQLRKVARER